MFKENNQLQMFGFEMDLNQSLQDQLAKTEEKAFYDLVFVNINEMDYKVLYSDNVSRPNIPINILVSALVLKERKKWSFNELIDSICFDMRTKVALGLSRLDEKPFSRATIFNFQKRILSYYQETGIHLLEQTFNNFTEKQLKSIEIKTNIQRSDSTLISSNIKKYSRVELLIEVLLRFWRELEDSDKKKFVSLVDPYSKRGSEKYVYTLKSTDLPKELDKLGCLYSSLYQNFSFKYSQNEAYKNFDRVFFEHFTIVENNAIYFENNQLDSGILQSPDDSDATYRKKRKQESQGFTLNATETAHPDNEVQILTDIHITENNVDDSKILENKIDEIFSKTPDLEELHTDGGYGSEAVDEKMAEKNITHVPTAIKGRQAAVPLVITKDEEGDQYQVECEGQKVESVPTKTRYKVIFDKTKCQNCPLKEKCQIVKNKGVYYFSHSDYLKNQRNQNLYKIPPERRKIRPNVEATIREFKAKTNGGKLKVRGLFKAKLFAFAMGISINFGRIFRYFVQKNGSFYSFFLFVNKISYLSRILNFYKQIKNQDFYFQKSA